MARARNFKDIPIKARFGRLTVEAFDGVRNRQACWFCRCDCGRKVSVASRDLRRGHTTQCQPCGRKCNWVDLAGRPFGSLTVVEWQPGTHDKDGRWLCRCICNKVISVASGTLRNRRPELNACPDCRRRAAEKRRKTKRAAIVAQTAKSRANRAVIKSLVCAWYKCHKPFAYAHVPGDTEKVYCSKRCQQKRHDSIGSGCTRARKFGCTIIERIDPSIIFERDHWHCGICLLPTNRSHRGTFYNDAPEIDHILNMASGGEHTYANTRCVHRRCNLIKAKRESQCIVLRPELAVIIREQSRKGKTAESLSRFYGVTVRHIQSIVLGFSWKPVIVPELSLS